MTTHDSSTNTGEAALTRKQELFITALLSVPTVKEAARMTDIGEKTAHRWLKLPHIQQAQRKAQREQYQAALSLLQRGVGLALRTLQRNMSGDIPPAVQVRAALGWLEQSFTVHRMQELEQTQAAILRKLETLGIKP